MVDYPADIDQAPRDPGPDEVRAQNRLHVHLRALAVAICIILLIAVGGIGYVVAEIRSSQVQNHSTLTNTAQAAQEAKAVADAIHSCVTPGLPCYERAQHQTAGAVSSINRVVILAAACASGLPTRLSVAARQTRIQSCVIQRLASHR